jgi:hypothetical protein
VIVHGNDDLIDAYGSGPNGALTAWSTIVDNGSAANASVRAYAICISA